MQIHLATISPAFVIGSWVMLRPKGTSPHRALGMTSIVLMAVSAVSTFWIRGIAHGGFSFLHLLSIFVLVALPYACSPSCPAACCARRCSVPEAAASC